MYFVSKQSFHLVIIIILCLVAWSMLLENCVGKLTYYYKPLVAMVHVALFCLMYFQPVTQEEITGYQVSYNGTMMNVNSSTTTLTFIAPSLPDGVLTGTVVVTVSGVNRLERGQPSKSETAVING